jgi:hypothetical protein
MMRPAWTRPSETRWRQTVITPVALARRWTGGDLGRARSIQDRHHRSIPLLDDRQRHLPIPASGRRPREPRQPITAAVKHQPRTHLSSIYRDRTTDQSKCR